MKSHRHMTALLGLAMMGGLASIRRRKRKYTKPSFIKGEKESRQVRRARERQEAKRR